MNGAPLGGKTYPPAKVGVCESQRYFKVAGRIVDIAWDLAIGSDLSLPEVEGERPILIRLSNAWAERILKAAEHDPYVAEVFGSVTDLLAPPTVLMRPRFVWRVPGAGPRSALRARRAESVADAATSSVMRESPPHD